ncbi:TM0106 family RecB-like putative nuclease [Luteococcus sediminum]
MEILLDPYAARSCPVKTHNRHDRTVERPRSQPDEALTELFAGGRTFGGEVLELLSAGKDVADLRGVDDPAEAERLTLEALAAGRAVVLCPRLPDDPVGHRTGSPDALVRSCTLDDTGHGYRPVEAKRHRVQEMGHGEHPCHWSPLADPTTESVAWQMTIKASREADLLQLAHYWRLLEACGHADPSMVAGLVGTDRVEGHAGLVVSWVQLDRKMIRTYSRTAATGWKLRSPMERYEHEFGFRLKVAQVAARRTGAVDDPRPMVQPIVIRECEQCTWWEACKPQLDDDDLSLRISKSPLDVREISVLRSHGINTLADLADADVESLMDSYLPEVGHRSGADSRLRLAARRASLMLAGVQLERLTTDPVDLPEASLEIDLDIETSAADRVYLWGFLVDDRTRAGEPYYKSFSRFAEMDNAAEVALAAEAIIWLDTMLRLHPDARVYHYSDYEVVHLLRLAERCSKPEVLAAARRVRRHFVDLFDLVKGHFFGTHGLGLKVVARSGPGFEWRDEDPGGLNSQAWFREAVQDQDPEVRERARTRVLEYNEDDVRATHQLRAWLRTLDEAKPDAGVPQS